jgi:PKD repeat protein
MCYILVVSGLSGCLGDTENNNEQENELPTVSIAYPSPNQIFSGEINITGSSSDPDGTVQYVELAVYAEGDQNYAWDYVSGNLSSWFYVWNTTHRPDGNYFIVARSFDGEAYSSWVQVVITINNTIENHPPVALFSFSINDHAVQFTDQSYDLNGDTLSYFWNFGDGSTCTQQNPLHVYAADGSYTVTLQVSDGNNTDEIAVMVTISTTQQNTPPTCNVSGLPTVGYAPQIVVFSMFASDVDGAITLWQLNIDSTGEPEYTGVGAPLEIVSHEYVTEGTYTATLTVTDDQGATATDTQMVTILEVVPNAAPLADFDWTPLLPETDQQINFNASDSYDTDGIISLYEWDWNTDGIYDGFYTTPFAIHTWSIAGEYVVTLRVTDNMSDVDTATKTVNVSVGNQPPTADFFHNPITPKVGEDIVFNASLSDDSDGTITEYQWSYQGPASQFPEFMGNGKVLVFNWSQAGPYNVTLTVIDDDGATDIRIIMITIEPIHGQNVSIACWNLQVFGPTKGSNDTLLTYYADKLDDHDIFIIQEIRDISGVAITNLAAKLPGYDYIISERAGTTSSKEQYAVFYNTRSTLVSQHDYQPTHQHEFERPPLEVTFTVDNWTFTLFTIHVKPSNVAAELTNLENITGNPGTDTFVIGDLNADGSYYDEDNIVHYTTWDWVITNDMDTTVAASDNTYDRIIINEHCDNNFMHAGVMDEVTADQSDHYLVYAVFSTEAI